jgi:hypothetical protein
MRRQLICGLALLMMAMAGLAAADPIVIPTRTADIRIDPTTLGIDATTPDGRTLTLMAALHAPEPATPVHDGDAWRWSDQEGRAITVSAEDDHLRVQVSAPEGQSLSWPLPPAVDGDWIVPDGEGLALPAQDAFWRGIETREHCLDAVAGLSFPAFAHLTRQQAVIYALGDGLRAKLCLRDEQGLQARLSQHFDEGVTQMELLIAVAPPDPLAPALFYRRLLKARGQFRPLSDKAAPGLDHLYGAPQAYLWGDGRDVAMLDKLKALGVQRINLSYDQDPQTDKHLVTPAFLNKARVLGYLAGPYDTFDNAQPDDNDASPYVHWGKALYPSGCIRDATGQIRSGFAHMGCEMSSEALVRAPGPFVPGARYKRHKADGASQVFDDVDATGEFFHDDSPEHPMTMSKDRANRLARLNLAIDDGLVIGSEDVHAWSAGVVHYSHGGAQSHLSAVWPVLNDHKRFGGWWPSDHLPIFFAPFQPTPDEARLLFGPGDRLPLFEAVFHDSVVSSDRWEFGLMKVSGVEGARFAMSLLYGTPTMWALDQQELARVGPWLKAAQDDFRSAHGWEAPVALTGFRWETPDRLVQTATYADGRRITANFGAAPYDGLATNCVRVTTPGQTGAKDVCPPPLPRSG